MVVQHNMQAMNANRQLGITTTQQGKSTEKLSTGYKINRAADDAAGLSISEKMRRQIRGLDRASTNAQDGVSSIQTAEGALNEVHDMLQRMNELANQAANGTNSSSDRQSIQDEISALNTEIDRVAETTKFNETYLLKGDAGTKEIALKGHDAGLKGTLADHGETATFEIDIKSDTDINISSHTFHIYEDKDKIETLQGQIDDADAVMINGTTYQRKVSVDTDGDISASVAKLKTSAATLKSKAASQTTEAAKQASAAAAKRVSAANKTGSSNKALACADKKSACAQVMNAKGISLAATAASLQAKAASIDACAAKFTASADSLTDAANKQDALATKLEAEGNHAGSVAKLKTSAATLKSRAASQTTEAAKQASAAAAKRVSAANKTGSSNKALACADKKSACAQVMNAKGTSLAAKAASLEAKAASIDASAAKFTASAEALTAAADAQEQTVKELKKADAGVSDELTKFIADGLENGDVGREYLASEIKAMIVDGAQIAIDSGNGFEKSRTAVDITNNKNNLTIDQVKTLVKDALLQANQIGADDESSVKVEEDSQQGDTYTFKINKGHVEVARAKNFELQVGADADLTNKIAVNIETMNSKYLGVQNLNVVDDSGVAATYAIDAIEDAITKVSAQRSELGAVQNRLEHTINNLDNVVENTQSAESSIRDTDIADEMVRYSKNNILSQAGQSMLAQANQSTQGALSLLG